MWHRWILVWALAWLIAPTAQAHLVTSQRGTLNIAGNGAYMVLSLPVSAFTGIDDDGDGLLSVAELRTHAPGIAEQVRQGVFMISDHRISMLEDVMINTETSDLAPGAPGNHLVVLGRFSLDPQAAQLRFKLDLFGSQAQEQTEQITVTRGAQTQLMTLTPHRSESPVLPSSWRVLADQVQLGAVHVLSGADHLLFLLVVLATGWNLRQMVLALSCFTAGHALTLMACAWFGLAVPSTIVEPAIAATIVGIAWFDHWSTRKRLNHVAGLRLSLVFACALIHGLGLAGALTDLGLDPNRMALSLLGFNLGIELGQIAVALLAAAMMQAIGRLRGPVALAMTTRLASLAAMSMGAFWFVERIAYAA